MISCSTAFLSAWMGLFLFMKFDALLLLEISVSAFKPDSEGQRGACEMRLSAMVLSREEVQLAFWNSCLVFLAVEWAFLIS